MVFAVGAAVFGLTSAAPGSAPGSASLAPLGVVGVAFAFGLVLLALVYAIGPVSGCHINPAVTLGVLLRKGISVPEAVSYWIAQFLGGIVGAAILQLLISGGHLTDTTGSKGANDWTGNANTFGAFLLEVLLTFLLVFVVLMVTGQLNTTPGFAGVAIGFTLVVCHLVGIPVDGTSVNPARSLGPALFAGHLALAHVWLFILAPLVGAALAAAAAGLVSGHVKSSPGATNRLESSTAARTAAQAGLSRKREVIANRAGGATPAAQPGRNKR